MKQSESFIDKMVRRVQCFPSSLKTLRTDSGSIEGKEYVHPRPIPYNDIHSVEELVSCLNVCTAFTEEFESF